MLEKQINIPKNITCTFEYFVFSLKTVASSASSISFSSIESPCPSTVAPLVLLHRQS